MSGAKKCIPVLEDYYECLHHRKEVSYTHPLSTLPYSAGTERIKRLYLGADRWVTQAARTKALQNAYRRAEAAHPRENAPKAGSIRNLGLLDREDDTRSVLGGGSK